MVLDSWNVRLRLRSFSTGGWAAWLRQIIPHFISLYAKFLDKKERLKDIWLFFFVEKLYVEIGNVEWNGTWYTDTVFLDASWFEL